MARSIFDSSVGAELEGGEGERGVAGRDVAWNRRLLVLSQCGVLGDVENVQVCGCRWGLGLWQWLSWVGWWCGCGVLGYVENVQVCSWGWRGGGVDGVWLGVGCRGGWTGCVEWCLGWCAAWRVGDRESIGM